MRQSHIPPSGFPERPSAHTIGSQMQVANPHTFLLRPPSDELSAASLLAQVDLFRIDAAKRLDQKHRSEMGQFLTPTSVSCLMSSMFHRRPNSLRLLDAGAGVGSLSAGMIAEVCAWQERPLEVHLLAYEIEPLLVEYLLKTFDLCGDLCRAVGIRFVGEVRTEDFYSGSRNCTQGNDLFPGERVSINAAILNPPYRKINNDSHVRRLLSQVGIETTNLYTAFLWLAEKMLAQDGEMVAITPRSFCNGPYFRMFRKAFARTMRFRRIHSFDSRTRLLRRRCLTREHYYSCGQINRSWESGDHHKQWTRR